MNHSSAHDLVVGYILDALSPQDTAAFEVHLTDCAMCQAEVAHLWVVPEALGSAHPVEPPPELELAVMQGLRPAPASSAAASVRTSPPRRRRWIPAVAAAIVLFTAGAVLGSWVRGPAQPTDVASAMAVAASPDAVAMPLTIDGSQTELVVSHDMDAAAVMGSEVPMPADGGVYQMWQKSADGTMTPVGSFTPTGSGHVAAPLSGSVSDTEMYVLTVEPEPDLPRPTGAPIAEVPM